MPYVFLAFFGLVVCWAPQWRLTAFVVFMSAAINIALADFYQSVTTLISPLITVFAFYALIDIITAKVLLSVRPFTFKGFYCGINGAKWQAIVLMFFIGFNGCVYADYTFHKYVLHSDEYYLKSVYIPMIFILNIAQILAMGINIGRNIRRIKPMGSYYHHRARQHSYHLGRSMAPQKEHREV